MAAYSTSPAVASLLPPPPEGTSATPHNSVLPRSPQAAGSVSCRMVQSGTIAPGVSLARCGSLTIDGDRRRAQLRKTIGFRSMAVAARYSWASRRSSRNGPRRIGSAQPLARRRCHLQISRVTGIAAAGGEKRDHGGASHDLRSPSARLVIRNRWRQS
jgi:hypothetical protein